MIPTEQPERGLFQVIIVWLCLATAAVGGRFWSRLVSRESCLGYDDLTCLVALLCHLSVCGIGFSYIRVSQTPPSSLTLQDAESALQTGAASYVLYSLCLGFIKWSALFFYGRVFRVYSAGFRRALWVGHIATLVWVVLVNALYFSGCGSEQSQRATLTRPPDACPYRTAAFLVSGIGDMLLDLFVLILPLPVIWGLSAKLGRKVLITASLTLGYCCFIASLGRFISVIIILRQGGPQAYSCTDPAVLTWTLVESGLGVVSICIPSLWCLYTRARKLGIAYVFKSSSKKPFELRDESQHSV